MTTVVLLHCSLRHLTFVACSGKLLNSYLRVCGCQSHAKVDSWFEPLHPTFLILICPGFLVSYPLPFFVTIFIKHCFALFQAQISFSSNFKFDLKKIRLLNSITTLDNLKRLNFKPSSTFSSQFLMRVFPLQEPIQFRQLASTNLLKLEPPRLVLAQSLFQSD